LPYLYTTRGLLRWCFFSGCPRMDVVFPWPSTLLGLHRFRSIPMHIGTDWVQL
ncbi:hypothetical protein LY78DRAFT_595348, partial [Colletotrichum sublineola]